MKCQNTFGAQCSNCLNCITETVLNGQQGTNCPWPHTGKDPSHPRLSSKEQAPAITSIQTTWGSGIWLSAEASYACPIQNLGGWLLLLVAPAHLTQGEVFLLLGPGGASLALSDNDSGSNPGDYPRASKSLRLLLIH